jgi:hypothetical protein
MDSEYLVETFSESHYSKFKTLYLNAFGKMMSVYEFKRRFNTTARGSEFVGFIAILKKTGEAVAFYGVFPLKIMVGGSVITAAVSGDTMTHKQHRNKGLFRKLASITYEKCSKMGFSLIYGFPNRQSYHGLVNSLGWKHVNDLNEWNLSLSFKISPVHKILKRVTFLVPLFNTYAHRVLRKYSVSDVRSFDNSNGDKYGIVSRDAAYINYKNGDSRLFIKMGEVIIWLSLSDVLWIGDFSDLDLVDEKVMSKLKHLARLLGYNSIRFAINQEISLPETMRDFKPRALVPTCILYLREELKLRSFLFTPADFDTW